MRKLPSLLSAVLVAFAVAALPGCSTNTQGDSASPVFLAGDFQLLPLQMCVNSNTPLLFATTVLRNRLKNPSVTATQFLDVQVDMYVCLLYTSDAADDLLCVDLGGRRI